MYTIGVITKGNLPDKLKSYIDVLRVEDFHFELNEMKDERLLEKDAIILIITDPQTDITEVSNMIIQLRSQSDGLICVYKKDAEKVERIIYLQLGVDWNILNDCTPFEFQLMLLNMLNRKKQPTGERSSTHDALAKQMWPYNARILMNEENSSIIIEAKEINLTEKEYLFLSLLYSRGNETVPYNEICQRLWKISYENSKNRVATIVHRIRDKFEKAAVDSTILNTVSSVGCKLKL